MAGLALAGELGVLGDTWLVVSLAITAAAAGLLALAVLPAQAAAMTAVGAGGSDAAAARARCLAGLGRLSAAAGFFAVMWAVVVVLMVLRPGSTTGV